MIWNSGIALIGLLALLIPLWIHLLSRRNARVQEFPSLRFLDVAPLVEARRSRLNDRLLLVIRLSILALAVAALAQPVLLSPARKRAVGELLARAIVIDTSASMLRTTASGGSILTLVRANADQLAREAAASIVLESAKPASMFPGAIAWLGSYAGKRELVVLSDFQISSIDSSDIASLPSEIGVRLVRSDSAILPATILESTSRRAGMEEVATTVVLPDRSDIVWTARASSSNSRLNAPLILTGAEGRAAGAAALEAVLNTGTPAHAALARPIAILFPEYAQFSEVLRSAEQVNAAWMGDVIAAIRADSAVVAATSGTTPTGVSALPVDTSRSSALISVLQNGKGQGIVFATRATVAGTEHLALIALVTPGSLESASLISAVFSATSITPDAAELEPQQLGNATLRAIEREAAIVAPRSPDDLGGASDARWFWIAALLLLGVESILRRSARRTPA